MPARPTFPSPLPAFVCLALALAGGCVSGTQARREEPPPQAPAPQPEAPAPQPPAPVSPPQPEARPLACIPRPAPSAEDTPPLPPPPEKAWLNLQLYELPNLSGNNGTSLQLRLSTAQRYSCLGYTIPARLSKAPGELLLKLGDVKPPSGPCPSAFGPAVADVVLPSTERGTFTLRLRHGGKEDQYRLVLEEDRIELSPLRVRFSGSWNPRVLLRAPEGALHVQCIFKDWENRCREQAAAGTPTCATFLADPVTAQLMEPLALKTGTYSLGFFNNPEGCDVRAPEGVEALIRHISERYRDPSNCLYITLHTWQGGGYSNY